ncbi:unnamed protein product [Soboliphyme baturini]|uniref:EGF-like domain-containing protein n=1 Tax=Soboliphyme baturini TaxID=241478 RepID=A0A183IYL0_9BILA|nr:unnamed protein product [Soboliphyme baturini]
MTTRAQVRSPLVLLVAVCASALMPGAGASKLFASEDECRRSCVGERDIGCASGPGGQHLCRCASNHFAEEESCKAPCEDMYWSLFTTGACVKTVSSEVTGVCQTMCAFRFRVWTTAFIIVLFASGKKHYDASASQVFDLAFARNLATGLTGPKGELCNVVCFIPMLANDAASNYTRCINDKADLCGQRTQILGLSFTVV